jgi:hypothetical protein
MAKITTTEIGKVYYNVEYEVPDEIAEQISELDEDGKIEEIKDLLEEYGEITYSEQENDGEAFEFELESVDEID